MLRDGIPLEGALRRLCQEMRAGSLRTELQALEADLAKGTPMADALKPRQLARTLQAHDLVGVKSGDLPGALTMLADYFQRQNMLACRRLDAAEKHDELYPLRHRHVRTRDFLLAALAKFLAASISCLLLAGVVGGVIFLLHFLFTLPMRRAERARLFLDLLESALKRGQSVEAMILSIAQSRDQTLGVRFHLLAAHIESGLRFVTALEKVPRFLPLQIAAMLRVGEKLGDLRRVLPACREILRDRPAAVRSAMHYMILVVLLFSPVFIFVVMMTAVMVIPKFKEVAAGMGVELWPVTICSSLDTQIG
jgi:type II secretory pathway component PulF